MTIEAEAERSLALFESAGAEPVSFPILQPADTLLDLYGEDIRARAFVTHDPLHGEKMLRPDFTVPVVQRHMASGAKTARYCYLGNVFRAQEERSDLPVEYIQTGVEFLGESDHAAADAEVVSLLSRTVHGLPVVPVMGDVGLLRAAVDGLETTAYRKAALHRHVWRPTRFLKVLRRYVEGMAVPEVQGPTEALPGLRSREEVEMRLEALRADAAAPLLDQGQADVIERLLGVSGPFTDVLETFGEAAELLPTLVPALENLARRVEALADHGLEMSEFWFDGNPGRFNMEYYDGMLFAYHAPSWPDLPAVASGGRYDSLTAALGGGQPPIPAVGGILRPYVAAILRGHS